MRSAYTFLGVILLLLLGAVLILTDTAAPPQNGSSPTNDNTSAVMEKLTLTSNAFSAGESIPSKYTCDGANTIPPLSISDVPESAQSLALIMDDPDIPDSVVQSLGKDTFDHWVVFNMPTTTTEVAEGQEPEGVLGANDGGGTGYTGPCPPDGQHRYFFKLFALDTTLDLSEGVTKAAVEEAMQGHIIEKTELMGRYTR